MTSLIRSFRKALWLALEHDVLNSAKAVAYSGMLALFPALVVLTALLAQAPEGTSLVGEVRGAFEQFLPEGAMSPLQSAMETHRIRSAQLIYSAAALSVFAGLGMMLSLMEGFRRAYLLPQDHWGFWQRRLGALLLVPIVLVPLSVATLVLVFGRQIEAWMIDNSTHELHHFVLFFWRMVRWAIALVTSVSVLGALYHFGTGHVKTHANLWSRKRLALLVIAVGVWISFMVYAVVSSRGHSARELYITNPSLFALVGVGCFIAFLFVRYILPLRQRKEHWDLVGPGAVAATLVWFPSTLAFGFYVTRIADYSMFYGPFGAGIATLVWLYITSFSALLGAELNGVLFRERQEQASAGSKPKRSRR
jgi:membrane protein